MNPLIKSLFFSNKKSMHTLHIIPVGTKEYSAETSLSSLSPSLPVPIPRCNHTYSLLYSLQEYSVYLDMSLNFFPPCFTQSWFTHILEVFP